MLRRRPWHARFRARRRTLVAVLATLVVLAPLTWMWAGSLLPSSYSMTDMGYADGGGGPTGMSDTSGMGDMGGGTSVTALREPPAPADVDLTLTARSGRVTLPSGRVIDGFTLNGQVPGPAIHVEQGQLVAVRLVNESVAAGVTLHWHGVDVPAGDDGTAGVTQDAVAPGQSFVYRFRANQVGTFWYHSHQLADPQVAGGLFGGLVITPRGGTATPDVLALTHVFGGRRTVDGRDGDLAVPAAPSSRVRVRVVNTDNGPMPVWVAGAPFRVVAIDGSEIHGPQTITDRTVSVTAGARTDLEVDMPADGRGARVEIGGTNAVVLGAPSPPGPRPSATFDPLTYGAPAALGFDPATASRHFEYAIGRRPGFVDGVPGLWWTVNGHLFPDVPMFMVSRGDVVRMRISNTSGDTHPMHLHGHHAVVLSRDGVPATGSPWWIDSLDVPDGHTFEIAFVADNPGIWMDHCHNLAHPSQGLMAHLAYTGVTTPFRVGGADHNDPE